MPIRRRIPQAFASCFFSTYLQFTNTSYNIAFLLLISDNYAMLVYFIKKVSTSIQSKVFCNKYCLLYREDINGRHVNDGLGGGGLAHSVKSHEKFRILKKNNNLKYIFSKLKILIIEISSRLLLAKVYNLPTPSSPLNFIIFLFQVSEEYES